MISLPWSALAENDQGEENADRQTVRGLGEKTKEECEGEKKL